MPQRTWKPVANLFAIMFGERLRTRLTETRRRTYRIDYTSNKRSVLRIGRLDSLQIKR
jgi:hypothetical protein